MDVGAPHTEEAHACTNREQKMELPLAEKGLKKYRKYINTRNKSTTESKRWNCRSQKRASKNTENT